VTVSVADFEKLLTVEIPCFVHGQIYQNFLKSRTMRFPYYNTMKLRAERLFVEVNVNTIYRCFLANAPRRTRHLPGRLKGSVTQLAVAVRVYCSFVDPGQNGRLGN